MTVFCITILRVRCSFTEKKICFGALALKKSVTRFEKNSETNSVTL